MLLPDYLIRAAFDGPWMAKRDGKPIRSAALKIGANSVDLSIGPELLHIQPRGACVDLHDPESFIATKHHCMGGFVLLSGHLYLSASQESFETNEPLWIPQSQKWREPVSSQPSVIRKRSQQSEIETYFFQGIEGRSTAARIGLSCHASAGFGDFGFSGQWVFELQAALPMRIYAGDRLAQVFFQSLAGKPETPYSGAYAAQNGATVARLGVERFR